MHHLPVTFDDARRILDGARDGRVLVVGDAMLDAYLTGRVDRISPEAPVPVVHVDEEHAVPGGAANVALGCLALGATCRLVAAVGSDGTGDELARLVEAAGLSSDDLISVPGRPTTRKTRVLARHHQMLRVDREDHSPMAPHAHAAVRERALEAIEWADVVVLEDYDKGVVTAELSRALLDRARARDIPSVVDPKLRHFFEFAGARVFKPNSRELAAAMGLEHPPRDAPSLTSLLARLGCENLLLTLGDEGMLLVQRSGEHRLFEPEAHEVFDVTGAGDTVTATLAVALLGGASVAQAADMANFAAGIEVTRLGAVPVSRDELLRGLARRRADDTSDIPDHSERTRLDAD